MNTRESQAGKVNHRRSSCRHLFQDRENVEIACDWKWIKLNGWIKYVICECWVNKFQIKHSAIRVWLKPEFIGSQTILEEYKFRFVGEESSFFKEEAKKRQWRVFIVLVRQQDVNWDELWTMNCTLCQQRCDDDTFEFKRGKLINKIIFFYS